MPEKGLFFLWRLCFGSLFFEEFGRQDSELLGEAFGEIGRRTETGEESDLGDAVSAFDDHVFRLFQADEFHEIVRRHARDGF